MNIRKLLMLLFSVGVIGSSLMGAHIVNAADSTTQPNNFLGGLVQMIADKFHLDKDQVQSVVNDYKQQHKGEMQQKMQQREEDRLTKLVQQGKITDAQKQAILKELSDLKAKFNPDDFKSLTPDQRKQKMQEMQNEIKSWAQSQGIDVKYIFPFGMGKRMYMKGMLK